jgi:hypothetical protein
MKIRTHVSVLLAAFVVGFLLYAAIVSYVSYQSATMRLRAVYASLDARSTVRYMTVTAVDAGRKTITAQYPDPFVPGGSPRASLEITIDENTAIMRQELIADQRGAYFAVTPLSSASFEEIVPGMKMRVHSIGTIGKNIRATLIVLGNPL